MKWEIAGNILDRILEQSKSSIKDDLEKAWNNIDESRMAKIVTFKNGDMVLKAENSAELQILSLKREEIKQQLNNKLNGKVKNIRFRLGG